MPRKTIASLEAEIGRLKEVIQAQEVVTFKQARLLEELQRRPPQTYLTYQPTGDDELDALQVAGRAIESLTDPLARDRCGSYLADRFSQIRED